MRHADIAITSDYGDRPESPPLSRIGGVLRRWLGRQRERHALSLLDGRLLKDIGVTPIDAAHEIEKPFWRP